MNAPRPAFPLDDIGFVYSILTQCHLPYIDPPTDDPDARLDMHQEGVLFQHSPPPIPRRHVV
jgi:hypothetical protein